MRELLSQGPQAGRLFPAVDIAYTDSETGATVRQLTDFKAHSNHVYFTNNGWYDNGERLLFNSDRGGAHNLYSINLETGQITQLTDLPALEEGYAHFSRNATIDTFNQDIYFWYGEQLMALDLNDLTLTVHYETPVGFTYRGAHNSVTANGEYVCTSIREKVDASSSVERWEAEPITRILRIRTDDGTTEVVHEESSELSHTNASPTNPSVITFAQEGPWDRTSQRIWGLNLESGETWEIRPEKQGEMIGHEFWLHNGEDVGYHGRYQDGHPFFGITRYDNESRIEELIPRKFFDHDGTRGHIAAHSRALVVSDGTPDMPYLFCWEKNNNSNGYGRPRKLVKHATSTFSFGRLHVHPRFNPDGSQVLYCSDQTEYANLYLVDIPDMEELPMAKA